jgi:demethylmenaquinone methyltransferase/2-methoxy-6-polyprenyl-1,4-benzoquinol methylase
MARASEVSSSDLTPLYARCLARLIQPLPNFDLIFVQRLRRSAVELLELRPGDRVLDAGCGPGGSFRYLLDKVGRDGEVVGVEISPEMASLANKRIQHNGWHNVHVLESAAERASPEGCFDALLMLGAPDVYGSAACLDNLLPHLKSNGRIVAFGAKLKRAAPARILNALFQSTFSKMTFASTPALTYEPWALLSERLSEFRVEEMFLGWMFLASGSLDAKKAVSRHPN